jgi:predicted transcriptional regulator
MTAGEIAGQTHLDRTTIQKSVKRLAEKNLLLRTQKNLPKGGYIFVYSIKGKKLIKERMSEIVKTWHFNVQKEIDRW